MIVKRRNNSIKNLYFIVYIKKNTCNNKIFKENNEQIGKHQKPEYNRIGKSGNRCGRQVRFKISLII